MGPDIDPRVESGDSRDSHSNHPYVDMHPMSQYWKPPKPSKRTLKLKPGQKPIPEPLIPFMIGAAYYDWRHFLINGKKQRAPTTREVDKGTKITVEDLLRLRQWCEDQGFVIPRTVWKVKPRILP